MDTGRRGQSVEWSCGSRKALGIFNRAFLFFILQVEEVLGVNCDGAAGYFFNTGKALEHDEPLIHYVFLNANSYFSSSPGSAT